MLANCAADAALHTSARAGKLDDAAAAQTRIEGVTITAANAAAAARPAILTHPRSASF